MKLHIVLARCAIGLAGAAALLVQAQTASGSSGAVDVGDGVPTAEAVAQGLFPEDECEQLKAAGFKCMGFRPAVRYSLPASSFRLGSAGGLPIRKEPGGHQQK